MSGLKPGYLGRYFSFNELTRTNHRKYLEENRREALLYRDVGMKLAAMLDVIREHYGKPVIVHSGFRCVGLNAAIGGSSTSQHKKFEAADFHVAGEDLREVWEWIWKESGIEFGQLILEGWRDGNPSWIHLSLGEPYRPAHKCGQVMTWSRDRGYQRVG